MYTLIRSATINTGKEEVATKFAHDIAGFVAEKYGVNVTVHRGLFSDFGKIIWFVQYESLAQFEEIMQATMEDADYQQALQSAQGYFVAGITTDQMLLSM